jgi:predicted PurR-regulated permease PerM
MLDSLTTSTPVVVKTVATSVWNQGSAAFGFFSLALITPVVLFYSLIDWPKMIDEIDALLPRRHAADIRAIGTEINARVSAFLRGQGTVCLLLAIYYAAMLSLIGLQYGLFVGSLTGLFSFIPVIGWWIGTFIAVGLSVAQYWPDYGHQILVVAVMIFGQVLESAIFIPNIIGSNVGLHPVWVIFALLTFGYLFGFLGLLVAVPVSAAIGVVVRFGLRRYLDSSLYRDSEQIEG